MAKDGVKPGQKWVAPQNDVFVNLAMHVAAHPFIYASLLCHGLLLFIFFSLGSFQVKQATIAENQSRVDSSMQEAVQSDMQRRVQELAKIKSLLEESVPNANGSDKKPPLPDNNQPEKDPAANAQTPAQLMKQAQDLLATIKTVEDDIKAKELARLLKIPEAEAIKKLADENKTHASNPDSKPAPASLEQLEQQANAALARRQSQLDQKSNGTHVANAGAKFRQDAAALAGDGMGNGKSSGIGSRGPGSDFKDTPGIYSDPRNYGAFLPTPAVSEELRNAAGNSFGAGGQFANRVYVNRWYIIGPFDADGPASMAKKYPPEMAFNLDAVYFGKDHRAVKWEYFHTNQYPLVMPVQAENAVYYGYTEINMDQERDLWMASGADDDAKVWFNNRVVWISGNDDKPWYRTDFHNLTSDIAHLNLSESKRKLHFNKGRNTFMFKLYNGIRVQFFSLTLSNEP